MIVVDYKDIYKERLELIMKQLQHGFSDERLNKQVDLLGDWLDWEYRGSMSD